MPVTTVRLGGRPDQPVMLLAPAIGSSVQALWGEAARSLAFDFQVVGWDLPGHGSNGRFVADHHGDFPAVTVETLARDVVEALDRLLDTPPGARPHPVHYVGHGIGGAVGMRLALERPEHVATLALVGCCLSAGGGCVVPDPRRPDAFDTVARRHPRAAEALTAAAERTHPEAVAAVRRTQAQVDLRSHVAEVRHPVLAVHGADDVYCDAGGVRALVDAVEPSHLEVLPGVAHLVAAEAPDRVASLLRDHALGLTPGDGAEAGADRGRGASGRSLDARTGALVRLAIVAARPGSMGEDGIRTVLDAARGSVRAGATPSAAAETLRLAWAERDAEGRLAAKVERMLGASL